MTPDFDDGVCITQAEFLNEFVNEITEEMRSLGMCDVGTYTPPAAHRFGAPTRGRIYVDRSVQLLGPQGQVITDQIQLEFVTADFCQPIEVQGRVEIGREAWLIDTIVTRDEATVTVLCSEAP